MIVGVIDLPPMPIVSNKFTIKKLKDIYISVNLVLGLHGQIGKWMVKAESWTFLYFRPIAGSSPPISGQNKLSFGLQDCPKVQDFNLVLP